ncbi:MAG: hypothetical protein QG552_292, partial [Thermodesulfobacteriota bacterium]|nr:hypothetical protein [Thermodesulfobacteriota bacterium]
MQRHLALLLYIGISGLILFLVKAEWINAYIQIV